MRISVQKLVAVLVAAALMVIAYYANYLPLKKSEAFIAAMRNMSNYRSIEEFKQGFAYPLDIPSPIGQEELVRNLGSMVVNIINSNGENNPALVAELLDYLDGYFQPIMGRGRGMSFSQNLYVLGNVYQVAFLKTKNPQYLLRARDYYEQANEMAPKRPQFLYGLLDTYRMAGDAPNTAKIANRILELWPDDVRLQEMLLAMQAPPPATSTVPTPKKK